jgi:hypothetical protein
MSINEFLTSQNVNLLWEVIKEDDINKLFTVEQLNKVKIYIQKTINEFFEKERINAASLKDINKKYIMFVISYAHKNLFIKNTNVIDISNVEKPELVTFEDIKKDRKNNFELELQKKQEEFTNAVTYKKPETPDFSDKLDEPIYQSDTLIEKIILQRNKEEEIFKNSIPINQEWITPKETSIKKEKYISENPNLIKIENNIASPLNDIIDLNSSKKHITWKDQEKEETETMNVFSKLKKIDNNEEIKNIKEEMKIMHTKIEELDKTMNNILILLKETKK